MAGAAADAAQRRERGLRLYVTTAATAAAVLAVVEFAFEGPLSVADAAAAAAFAIAFLILERTAVTLVWRDQRFTSALTEAAVFSGLVFVPGGLLAAVAWVPRFAIDAWGRKPPLKLAFNLAQVTFSVGVGVAAAHAAHRLGAGPLVAAAIGTAAFGLNSELMLSGVFGILDDRNAFAIYRERFLRRNGLTVGLGIVVGTSFVALYHLHPLATLIAPALIFILNHYARLQAKADRELELRRHLAMEGQNLLGVTDSDEIARRVLQTARALLYAGRARLRLQDGREWEQAWEQPAAGTSPCVSASVAGPAGDVLGEIVVWSRPGREALDQQDQALLSVLAAQTAQALRTAEALRQVADQQKVLARQEQLSALGTLVAGVAHEVNNPLTYLRGHIELTLMDLDDLHERVAKVDPDMGDQVHGSRRALQTALGGADRISHIVKALRAVARANSAGPLEPVDLNAVVENVSDLMRMSLPDNVALQFVAADKPALLHGRPSEIHQVALNLVKNGVEALEGRPGRVTLRVRRHGETVELEVADTGKGIPPDVRAKLFTPFFTTKGASGTGLGLSIVDGIVRDHGGRIEVTSEPGQGSRFVVAFPARNGAK